MVRKVKYEILATTHSKILENIKRQGDKGAQIPGIPTRGPGGVRWLMNETPLWVQ